MNPITATMSCLAGLVLSCAHSSGSSEEKEMVHPTKGNYEKTVQAIPSPASYNRVPVQNGSFAAFLRAQTLKEDKTVYLFNGSLKSNQEAQYAVLDVSVGEKDLQQCADAVMRLRAEYLYGLKKFDEISFVTGTGKVLNYSNWIKNKINNRATFMKYLEYVFSYCGTASLPASLKHKALFNMQAGDILLKPGSPGHAVIIMDMAERAGGKKTYLLAQSYMPAQNIHILKNPTNSSLNPWYALTTDQTIETPEWTFYSSQLYEWK